MFAADSFGPAVSRFLLRVKVCTKNPAVREGRAEALVLGEEFKQL